jgi:hypothetical protein
MGFMDILSQYAGRQLAQPVDAATEQFDQVAQQAPQSVISQELAGAFRADQPPPFGRWWRVFSGTPTRSSEPVCLISSSAR